LRTAPLPPASPSPFGKVKIASLASAASRSMERL
jgi:hypothetical protein